MTPPKLFACHFEAKKEPDGQYDRLARVLRYTAQRHCRRWDLHIDYIQPHLYAPATGNPSHAWNAAKLEWWVKQIEACPDGARVVVMDVDTFILRPLDPLWDHAFDLMYTARNAETSRLPLNGGVVALRMSPRVREAMLRWQHIDYEMCKLGKRHGEFHRKYAGMNQSSFGCMLEEGGFDGLKVISLPCQEWNCCEWLGFDPNITRIVHVKSRLRRAVFGSAPPGHPTQGNLGPLVVLWHDLEQRATAPTVRTA